jgi:hypothetical protein
VVPRSPTAQGSPAEEEQQPEGHDMEDKADEEHSPPTDTEDEKMYRDADEVESFKAEASVLSSRLRVLLEHLASPLLLGTGSRKSRVQGRWSSEPS